MFDFFKKRKKIFAGGLIALAIFSQNPIAQASEIQPIAQTKQITQIIEEKNPKKFFKLANETTNKQTSFSFDMDTQLRCLIFSIDAKFNGDYEAFEQKEIPPFILKGSCVFDMTANGAPARNQKVAMPFYFQQNDSVRNIYIFDAEKKIWSHGQDKITPEQFKILLEAKKNEQKINYKVTELASGDENLRCLEISIKTKDLFAQMKKILNIVQPEAISFLPIDAVKKQVPRVSYRVRINRKTNLIQDMEFDLSELLRAIGFYYLNESYVPPKDRAQLEEVIQSCELTFNIRWKNFGKKMNLVIPDEALKTPIANQSNQTPKKIGGADGPTAIIVQ